MLGLEDREELFAFFKANNVPSKFTIEDIEKEQATAAAIFGK